MTVLVHSQRNKKHSDKETPNGIEHSTHLTLLSKKLPIHCGGECLNFIQNSFNTKYFYLYFFPEEQNKRYAVVIE